MAQVRWYLNATTLDGWALVDQTAASAATLANGWVVGTGSTNSSEFQSSGGDRASSTFVGNTVPDGTLDTTLKDAFRSQYAQNGSFAAGNWTFQFAVVGTVQSGAADGQIVFRILKADADGSNATELTSGQQATTVATNVAGTDVNISATVALGALTITNQYLFIQVAWKRTGAGGMTTTNIRLRTGSSSTVGTTGLTADYTPLVLAAHVASTAVIVGRGPTVRPDQAVTGGTILSGSLAGVTLLFEHPISGSQSFDSLVDAGLNFCQTISGHTGALTSVSLSLYKVGAPTDAVYLEVRESTINGPLLATSASVSCTTLSAIEIQWINFSLPNAVTLSASTTYWIKIFTTRVATDESNYVRVRATTDSSYAGGDHTDYYGNPTAGRDYLFRLYVLAPPAIAHVISGQTIHSTARIFYTETLLFDHPPVGSNFSSEIHPGINHCQTISGHTGTLTRIDLYLDTDGSPTDAIYLEVRQDTLNGTLLGTSLLVPASVIPAYPTKAWIPFYLPGAIVLLAGTTYWIKVGLSRTVSDGTRKFEWLNTIDSSYGAGDLTDNVGTILSSTRDGVFRLYTGTSHTVANAAPSQAVTTPPLKSSSRVFYAETVLFSHSQATATFAGTNGNPGCFYTQSISGHDGLVTAIGLYAYRVGTLTDSIYVELRQSTVNGTLLATSIELPCSTISTGAGWVSFPLPTPVVLAAGTTYWIKIFLTRLVADNTKEIRFYIDHTPDTYAGGSACNSSGVPWDLGDGPDIDHTFRLMTGTSHTILNGDLIVGETIASGSQVHVPTVAEGDKVVRVAFIGTSLAPVAVAAFNFRGSAAYVTDGAGQTYVLGSTAYPTNRDSLTFGWLTSALHANRSTSVDVRLAGLNYATGSVDEDFKFDLPSAGTYLVGLAMGDITAAQSNQQIEIYDNTTLLLTLGRRNVSAGEFWDASDVKYTAAAWPTSQTPVSLVFATSTLILRLKGDGNSSAISHLSVEDVPTGGSAAVLYPVDVAHVAAGTQTIDGATITSTSQLSTPAINTVAVPTILSGARVGTTLLFENPWSGGTLSATLAGRNFSQTISGHDGLLTSVALKLRKNGLPTDAIYVDIRDAFNGTLLATSASLAFSDVPPGSTTAVNNWYLFPLDTPVPLVAATTYWIGVYRTAGSVSKFPYLLYDLLEPYPAGVLYDASGAPQSGGSADLAFRLYVAAAPTVAPSQAVTTATIAPVLLADSFAYSDGALPTVSGIWAKPSDWPNPIAVASGLAKGTASGDNAAYLTNWTGSTVAQWSAITIDTFDPYAGPTVFNSTAGDFYLFEVRPSYGRLFRVRSNQNFENLGDFGAWGATPSGHGDVFALEAVVVGGNPVLTIRRNGGIEGTYEDTHIAKVVSGVPGLRIWNATTRISLFEAGAGSRVQTFAPSVSQGVQAVTTFPIASGSRADSFSYSDGALPTVSGGIWAKPSDWPNPIAVASGLAKGTASGDNAAYLANWAGSTVAQWAEVTISTFDDYVGPTVFNSPVGDFYFFDARQYYFAIYRVRSNQFFDVIAGDSWASRGAPPAAAGDVLRIEVRIDIFGNPVVSTLKNGIQIVTDAIDIHANAITSGVPGFRVWNTTARVSFFEAGGGKVQGPSVAVVIVPVLVATIGSSATVSAPSVSGGVPTTSTVVLRRAVPQFYRDIYRRSYTLRYRRIVVTVEAGPAPPTTQTIVGATIGGSVGDLLLEDSSGVLLEDGSALLLEGSVGLSQVFAPTVAHAAVNLTVLVSDLISVAETAKVTVPVLKSRPVEVVSVADTVKSVLRQIAVHAAETVAVADAATPLVKTIRLKAAVADAVTVTDFRRAVATPLAAHPVETVTVTDAVTPLLRTARLTAQVADTIAVTELRKVVATPLASHPVETIAVTDSAAPLLRTARLKVAVAETVTALDAVTPLRKTVRLTASVADAVTVTEFVKQVPRQLAVHAADNVLVEDAPIVGAALISVRPTDLVTVADVAKVVLSPLTVRVAETVTVVDFRRAVLPQLAVHAADAIAVTELRKAILPQVAVHAAETITVTELRKAVLPQLAVHAAEIIAVADVVKRVLPQLVVRAAEVVAVTDFRKVVATPLAVHAADSVSVAEFVKRVSTPLAVHAAETIAVTDFRKTVSTPLAVHAADHVTVTDVLAAGAASLSVSRVDGAAVTDVLKVVLRPQVLRAVETITVTDTVRVVATPLVVRKAETITALDVVSTSGATLTLSRAVADSVGVTDAVRRGLGLGTRRAETVTVTETRKAVVGPLVARPVETVTATDAATLLVKTVRLKGQPVETVTVTDAARLVVKPLMVRVAETVTVLDSVRSGAASIQAAVAETIAVADSVKAVLPQLAVRVAETVTALDAVRAVLPALAVHVEDSLTVVEAVRAVLPQLGAHAADAVTVSDAPRTLTPTLAVHAAEVIAVEVDVLAVVALPRVRYAYVVETIAVTDSTPETSAQTIVHFVVGELRDTGSRSHLNGLVVSDDFEGVLMGGTGGTLESDDFAGVLVGVHGGSLRRVEEP